MFVHYSRFFRTFGASLITVGYSGHVLFEGKGELKSTSGLWILDLLIYNVSMSVHLPKINFANGSWQDGMHMSVMFNRSHCSGKDRKKKHRTDSCLQQENSDSRTMWDDCMKWNFDHQRLYKMDLLKLNLRNQFCVPCFLHFECQRNTSSTIVAYVKKTFASWHCEESISPRVVNPSNLQIDGSEIPIPNHLLDGEKNLS